MSKILCVVRAVNEVSLTDCISSLKRLGFDYEIIQGDSSLESKAKRTIEIGKENADKYDWIMTVDADVIINRSDEWVADYCNQVEKTNKNLFCFTGWLDCTKRGLISGLHFYKTNQCEKAYNFIKDEDFSFHKGREEYEICKLLKEKYKMDWDVGKTKESFGKHLFEVNN